LEEDEQTAKSTKTKFLPFRVNLTQNREAFNTENYIKVQELGRGGQAVVYKVMHRCTRKFFAMKVYIKQTIDMKRRFGRGDTYSNFCQVLNANK
jgi:serine/threonine protein kinase